MAFEKDNSLLFVDSQENANESSRVKNFRMSLPYEISNLSHSTKIFHYLRKIDAIYKRKSIILLILSIPYLSFLKQCSQGISRNGKRGIRREMEKST